MPLSLPDAFWTLHHGLLRQAPGSDASTRLLLDLARPWPDHPRAVDLGAGPGRSSLVLAAAGAHVTAVDTHGPFLAGLRTAAAARQRLRLHGLRASPVLTVAAG